MSTLPLSGVARFKSSTSLVDDVTSSRQASQQQGPAQKSSRYTVDLVLNTAPGTLPGSPILILTGTLAELR